MRPKAAPRGWQPAREWGALWGLGIVAGVLPAVGPAIAGGTLAAILTSAAAGAAAAGLAGTLIGLGIPKHEAEYYESEVEAGRIVVTVRTGGRYAEVLAVMRRFGGYDMDTREDREFDPGEFDVDVPAVPPPVGPSGTVKPDKTAAGHQTYDVPVQRDDIVTPHPSPTTGRTAERTRDADDDRF